MVNDWAGYERNEQKQKIKRPMAVASFCPYKKNNGYISTYII